VPEEGLAVSPETELQALLAENAIEGLLDDAALLREKRVAERRPEPMVHGLRKMCA
jgi:hypothetical protein